MTLQPITDLRAKLLNQTTMLWNAKAMTGADMRKHSPVSSKRTLFGGFFSSDQQVSEINYFWYFVSVTLTCGFQWGVLPRGCHWTSCRDQTCDPGFVTFVYLNIGSFLITAFLFLIILFQNLPYPKRICYGHYNKGVSNISKDSLLDSIRFGLISVFS